MAYDCRTWPASVSEPSREERSNRRSPSSSSSLEMVWLTADWVRCMRVAAREKLFSSATARNVSSWKSSIITAFPVFGKEK